MNAIGLAVTRPVNDWCPNGDLPPARTGSARVGSSPALRSPRAGTTGAPSTPRCTRSTSASTARRSRCATPPARRAAASRRSTTHPRGRVGSRTAQYTVVWSTLLYDVANRYDLTWDQAEIYIRGEENAPRPACCPPPFEVANNWMHGIPDGAPDPARQGAAERRRGEPTRGVAPGQRHRGRAEQVPTSRPAARSPSGDVHRRDDPGPPWAREHGARDRRRRLRRPSPSSTRLRERGATGICGAPTSSRFRRARGSPGPSVRSRARRLDGGVTDRLPTTTCSDRLGDGRPRAERARRLGRRGADRDSRHYGRRRNASRGERSLRRRSGPSRRRALERPPLDRQGAGSALARGRSLPALEPITRAADRRLTGSTRTSGRCGTSASRPTRSRPRRSTPPSTPIALDPGGLRRRLQPVRWPAAATARARLTAFFAAAAAISAPARTAATS